MSQIDMSDPRFKIKLVSAKEALRGIPVDVLIVKIVDLYRRTHGKTPLLRNEGGFTEEGAKMTKEEIRKEFEEIPKGNSDVSLLFGKS